MPVAAATKNRAAPSTAMALIARSSTVRRTREASRLDAKLSIGTPLITDR
jgi:hypothetical protein